MSSQAFSYPENIRLGYRSCVSCHVSPTGGGVLNEYGKGYANEMSMFKAYDEKDDEKRHVLIFGGNTRYVFMKRNDLYDKFLMQSDIEAAWKVNESITIDASAGIYGREKTREYRKYYAMIQVNDYVRFRAGRFFPAWGLNLADHSLAIRRNLGFNQGSESYNAELSYIDENGELFITGTSDGTGFKASESGSVELSEDSKRSFKLKYNYFLFDNSFLGFSYSYSKQSYAQERLASLHAVAGFTKALYLAVEYAYQKDLIVDSFADKILGYAKLGYFPWLWLEAYSIYEYQPDNDTYHYGVRLFPITHVELDARYFTSRLSKGWLAMANLYL